MTLSLFPVSGRHSYRDTWQEPRPDGRRHAGVDIIARAGTPVLAAVGGRVLAVLDDARRACGFGLVVAGVDGRRYTYCHLRAVPPWQARETIRAGELVGYVGETGDATGPHLHFAVEANGRPVNPFAELRAVEARTPPSLRRPASSSSSSSSSSALLWLLPLALFAWWHA